MLVNILSKIFFPLVASLTNCLRLKELHKWRCLNWLNSPAKIIPAPGLVERTESIDWVRCAIDSIDLVYVYIPEKALINV
jgi:hypothetical protein